MKTIKSDNVNDLPVIVCDQCNKSYHFGILELSNGRGKMGYGEDGCPDCFTANKTQKDKDSLKKLKEKPLEERVEILEKKILQLLPPDSIVS